MKPFEIKKSINHFCSVVCLCRHNNKIGKNIKKRNTKPERKVKQILNDLNIDYKTQYRVTYLNTTKYYDVYIPSLNLLIEIDGIYWHSKGLKRSEMNKMQLRNRKNDLLKNRIAKMKGFNLVRIWEDEIDNYAVMEILCAHLQ